MIAVMQCLKFSFTLVVKKSPCLTSLRFCSVPVAGGDDIAVVSAKDATTPRTRVSRLSQIIFGMKTYKILNSIADGETFSVPQKFIVPHNSPDWPQDLWGVRLGTIANKINHGGAYKRSLSVFQDLGLVPKHGSVAERAQKAILAVKVYKRINDINDAQVFIPRSFIVPTGDVRWPKNLWGMKLGEIMDYILHMNGFDEYRHVFDRLGLSMRYGPLQDRAQQLILAIQTYRKIHNIPPNEQFSIPQNFVVPEHTRWPAELWGMKLGDYANRILQERAYAEYRPTFDQLGLRGKLGTTEERVQRLMLAVETYRTVHGIAEGQPTRVRRRFVVPEGDAQWPEALWGMHLGNAVYEFVSRNSFAAYTEQFKALGLHRKVVAVVDTQTGRVDSMDSGDSGNSRDSGDSTHSVHR